jgi:SPP1 gp7 family putative phage head morphogenesis protein
MPTLAQDPTHQAGRRRRVRAEFKKRLAGANREINKFIESLPVRTRVIKNSLNVNKTIYEWLVDRFGYAQALREIRAIVEKWLQTNVDERENFFNTYIEEAYRDGTISASMRVSLLAEQAQFDPNDVASLDPVRIINSIAYQDRLNIVFTRQFTEMKGFSDSIIVDIARILTDTISSNDSPRVAQRKIKKSFKASRARAERIARTEINRSNSLGRLEQNKAMRNDLGIDVRVIHRSALQGDRTRDEHGKRHGKVFTIEDQQRWWDQDANRINCLCSTAEIIFDSNGKPYSNGVLKRLKAQRITRYGK